MTGLRRGWELGSQPRQQPRTPVSRPSVLLRLRCKVMGHGPFLGGWLEITCLKCKQTWRAK